MEVQVRAKEKYGGIISISFLFDKFKDEEHKFLKKLGFGKNKYAQAKFTTEVKKPQYMRGKFNLQELFKNQDKYMMYEGESQVGKCEPAIVFVSHHLNWISDQQFKDLVDEKILAVTKARRQGQLVYQNIDKNLNKKPFPLKEEVDVPKTPSNLAFSTFTYNPYDIHSLGWIHPHFIPGWKKVSHRRVLKKVKMPKLPRTMKYLPLWYEHIGKKGLLKPIYVIVPKGFKWMRNIQPGDIPIYIRTNYTQANGVRNIIKIRMPIRWNPHEKVKPSDHPRRHHHHHHHHGKKKKKHRLNLKMKKPMTFRFRRICTKWHMGVILNRYFMDKEAWNLKDKISGINPGSLLQCRHWRIIRINHLGQEVDAAGKVLKNRRNGNLDEDCVTYISVILNKVNHPGLRDYVSQSCGQFSFVKRAPFDKPGYVVPPVAPKEDHGAHSGQKTMLAMETNQDVVNSAIKKERKEFLRLLQH